MKLAAMFLMALAAAFPVRGQALTTEQVLARIDANARSFRDMETSIQQTHVEAGFAEAPESGKLYFKMVKSAPRVRLEITQPARASKSALIDEGTATVYYKNTNSYVQRKVDPNSDALRLLLIGFGVPSETFTKVYKPEVKGLEQVDGKSTTVLELTSISPQTRAYEKLTLWLDPQTWNPVQTRITQPTASTDTFRYSDMKVNKGVADSVFRLNIPRNATKQ